MISASSWQSIPVVKPELDLTHARLAKEERAAKVGNFVQRFQLSGTQLNALTDDSLETYCQILCAPYHACIQRNALSVFRHCLPLR